MLINVRDFATVQDALNAAHDGDRVYMPSLYGQTPAYYQPPDDNGWTINKRLEILGDGIGDHLSDTGTTIRPTTASESLGGTVFNIAFPLSYVHIHDLKIRMPSSPTSTGSKHAIYCATTSGANNKVNDVRMERVSVVNHGGDAFHFNAYDSGNSAIIALSLVDCEATLCGGNGMYLRNTTVTYLLGGRFAGNRKKGVFGDAAQALRLISVGCENNEAAASSDPVDAQIRLSACHGFTMIGCHVEDYDNHATIKTAVTIDGTNGGYIGSNSITNPSPGVTGSRGIMIFAGSTGIVVGPNDWAHADKLIEISNSSGNSTNCVVLPQAVRASDANTPGTITLPDVDGNGNFAYVPTTKTSNVGAGLLLPRITTTTRDAIPAGILQRGILVFNSTTNKLNFYSGSAWEAVTSA